MANQGGGRFKLSGYLAAAVAVALLIGGVTWWLRSGPDNGGKVDAAWRVKPNAFSTTHDWMAGPQLVLPDPNGCFVAYGQDNTGYGMVPGFWKATGDCTTVDNTSPRRRLVDGLPSEDRSSILAAVPAHGGGYLALSRTTFHSDYNPYVTSVLAGDAEAGFRLVARFSTADQEKGRIGPQALVATADGYAALGYRDKQPLAWTSTTGENWQEVALPGEGTGAIAMTSGPDGRLVAVTVAKRTPMAWVSTDQGAHWQVATMPDAGNAPQLWTIVHTGHEYLAFGGVDGNVFGAALVYTSPDGLGWTRQDVPEGMYLVRDAVALPDGSVLAAAATGTSTKMPNEQCALAWRWDGTGWTGEELGCHGVPESLAALPDRPAIGAH